MVANCGTLCYILKTIISFALFFLSGLPGAIDYMLLYLVKTNKINSISEKKIYTFLSAYIRAPGCTYTLVIGMNRVFNYYNEKRLYKICNINDNYFINFLEWSILFYEIT